MNHICVWCGKEFRGRYGAKTCSPNCRKALSRRKDEIKAYWWRASVEIDHLGHKLDKYPDLDTDIRNKLRHLRDLIDSYV